MLRALHMGTEDVRMKGFSRRWSVAEAHALIDARVEPLGLERVPFNRALGRILAEDVRSDRDVPPHPKSAMDGYAVRAADLPGRLEVVGQIMAAEQYSGPVGPGQAVRIMTGAKIPDGADTVVMVENTRADGEHVQIDIREEAGRDILQTGEDLREGQIVLPAGRRIRASDLSMLVNVGALEVQAQRRPRVRLVPTGSELVPVGRARQGSEVVESNSFMLEALAARDGASTEIHPIVRDDMSMLRRALLEPGADLIVVTGGSSVGMEDLGPVVLREIGELPIHGLHMRPASPAGLGFVQGSVVVLAPGYPVSCLVAWDMIARHVLQRMSGVAPHLPYPKIRARLATEQKKPSDRIQIQRVILQDTTEGVPLAAPIPGGSALLSTATRADAFVVLPEGESVFESGRVVDAYLYELRS